MENSLLFVKVWWEKFVEEMDGEEDTVCGGLIDTESVWVILVHAACSSAHHCQYQFHQDGYSNNCEVWCKYPNFSFEFFTGFHGLKCLRSLIYSAK